MAADEENEYVVQYVDEEEPQNWISKAGKAKVSYKNGDLYEGDFNDQGKKHGKGVYEYKITISEEEEETEDEENKRRHVYDGQWYDGMKHGIGKMIYPDGSSYEGEWANGEREGEGVYRYVNGDIYSGSWAQDMKSGQGVYVYANDVQLVGTWKENSIQSGKWVFADGSEFEGPFDKNVPYGEGSFQFHNGIKHDGSFIRVGKAQSLKWRAKGE